MRRSSGINRLSAQLTRWSRDRRGSSAVEFAIICAPFVFTLLAILQMGIYYMTQAALDTGVNAEADALNTTFYTQVTPSTPSAATLKSQIASKAGAMINASALLVDLQPFTNLTAAAIPIGTNAQSRNGRHLFEPVELRGLGARASRAIARHEFRTRVRGAARRALVCSPASARAVT